MPLKRSSSEEAYEYNLGKLLDEYKRSGTIGKIRPANLEMARNVAKVIAEKIRKENKYYGKGQTTTIGQ